MSQANVDLVVGQFESTNARQFTGVMDAWTDDVVLIVNDDLGPFSTSLTGKPAVGEWFGDWFRQFAKDYRFDIEEALDAGDDVVVVAHHHGSGRRSGAAVERRAAYVFSVREGRIAQIELWLHEHARDAALEAAGLSA